MTFSWRLRRGGRGGARKGEASREFDQDTELAIPNHFKCPISLDLMKDPVTLSTGITYDRESIEKWIESGKTTCPVTNQALRSSDLIPNHSIRVMIQAWCVLNKSYGVERIPTPRIPTTPYEVSDIRSRIEAAARRGDAAKCRDLLVKIRNLAKESERNKRCLVGNGVGISLAECFEFFARVSCDAHVDLLKEILSVLTWAFPLSKDGISKMKSPFCLRGIALLLKNEDDLSARQNAVCVMKNLVSSDPDCVRSVMAIEGIEETLFQIVKVPICPRATKASLVVIQHVMAASRSSGVKFVNMGIIPLLLEALVDGDKSVSEKALGVMDRVCSLEEGRVSACQNALTVPLLVKKILRVSDAATEASISSLWKICSAANEEALVEAVRVGAFQKLLVVLQIGSGERTKEKVTELLKLMNMCRDKVDCFDSSMGFKYVKRSN